MCVRMPEGSSLYVHLPGGPTQHRGMEVLLQLNYQCALLIEGGCLCVEGCCMRSGLIGCTYWRAVVCTEGHGLHGGPWFVQRAHSMRVGSLYAQWACWMRSGLIGCSEGHASSTAHSTGRYHSFQGVILLAQ